MISRMQRGQNVWIGLGLFALVLVACEDGTHSGADSPKQRAADSLIDTNAQDPATPQLDPTETTDAQRGDVEPAERLRTYTNAKHDFRFSYPQGWSVMSPDEVYEKTGGLLTPSPAALVFVVNDGDPDKNINVLFTGDVRREAPNNGAARRFFEEFREQYPSMIRQQLPGARVVSTRVFDHAGGVAFEAVYNVPRGQTPMRQKSVLVIVSGKAYTFTCTSLAAVYDEADRSGFKPILDTLTFEQ